MNEEDDQESINNSISFIEDFRIDAKSRKGLHPVGQRKEEERKAKAREIVAKLREHNQQNGKANEHNDSINT
jgi:hypothetical protein